MTQMIGRRDVLGARRQVALRQPAIQAVKGVMAETHLHRRWVVQRADRVVRHDRYATNGPDGLEVGGEGASARITEIA